MALETPFSPNHSDRLTVLELNNDSSKLLTASIDHRVAVYDVDPQTSARKQLDVFTAHDAEIRDAKWFHSSTGTNFVTIGNDLQLRIWTQDVYQAPMSGRRFRKIGHINCEQLVPFSSVDVKTIGQSTYIAVIDRQGLLSLYEMTKPDEFNDWTLVDQFYVCSPTPGRGDHTSFRVRFDPNLFPLPYVNSLSDDKDQLAIAVTAMNEFKLYRSTADPSIISSHESSLQSSNVGRGASRRLILFEVLRISPSSLQSQASAGLLLRDVAIAAGNFRGTDVVAMASMNGTIAIHEIFLQSKASLTNPPDSPTQSRQSNRPNLPAQHSNLTSALNPAAAITNATQQAQARLTQPFPYTHHAVPVSIFQHAHMDAWSVRWDMSGQMLLSSGNDGTVKMWKRVTDAGGQGAFELFAEQAGDDDDSETGSTEEDNN